MRLLRGGPSNPQSEFALHNQTNVLRSVNRLARGTPWSVYALRIFTCQIIHWPHHLAGSTVSECFFINIIFLLFLIWFIFLSKFKRLGYHALQRLVWAGIFEIGIYFVILYYFRILIYPKGFLLWPLIGTEKVRTRSVGLSRYSVGSHLYIFCFDIFTGCDPLALGRYSVGSHLFLICQFTGSYLFLAIRQLKTYYKVNYQIQQTRVRAL
jgi:hypothetical protein